jgi:hypothetical protein
MVPPVTMKQIGPCSLSPAVGTGLRSFSPWTSYAYRLWSAYWCFSFMSIFAVHDIFPRCLYFYRTERTPDYKFNIPKWRGTSAHLFSRHSWIYPHHWRGRHGFCRYQVTEGDFSIIIMFIGVDSTVPCGRCSTVDFVHFIWQNDMLGFRRHALAFLPESPLNHGRLLCLRHYRVASIGWSFSRCVICADNFWEAPACHRLLGACWGLRL